jgi:hypothetical protein
MMTAKCLRRQAATCANLAKQTDDDESRERYLRLQQLYLQLVASEDNADDAAAPGDNSGPICGDGKPGSPAHRPL